MKQRGRASGTRATGRDSASKHSSALEATRQSSSLTDLDSPTARAASPTSSQIHGSRTGISFLDSAPDWLLGLLLFAAVIVAYQPVWHAGFIWDDEVYVTDNKLLTAPDGLQRIWFSTDSPSQYFPLVYTAFRFERMVWGLNPSGYHWVNILLHALNALLLWKLLTRLNVPAAWLGAAFFALHPVQVESVAWITERKNVLSLLFILLALLSWIGFVENRGKRPWVLYGLSLLSCSLALFSKTTACTLPLAMALVLWLRSKPIDRNRLAQLSPFVLASLAMGLVTMWWERYHVGTTGGVFTLGPVQRVLIASHAVWFYAGKLLWPVNLTFSYPRWIIDPADPFAYGWILACALLAGWIYFARRSFGRSIETTAVFYVATLSPTLGFIMLFTFRYTFVADHYQYAASIGPLALIAAGITTASAWLQPRAAIGVAHFLRTAFCAAMLVILGALTWHQAQAYRNLESLWRDTVAKNPESWLAHSGLGRLLIHQGRFDEAMEQYTEALRINPGDVDSLISLGNALFGQGRQDEAMAYYEKALQVSPDNPESHVNLAVILANRGRTAEAIEHDRKALQVNPKLLGARLNLAVCLVRIGQFEEALEQYHRALELNPDQPLAHINLAIALTALGRTNEAAASYHAATQALKKHADALAQQGRMEEAAAQLLEGTRRIPNNAEGHCQLAVLLARMGKPEEARTHFIEALRIEPDYKEAQQGLRELTKTGDKP